MLAENRELGGRLKGMTKEGKGMALKNTENNIE